MTRLGFLAVAVLALASCSSGHPVRPSTTTSEAAGVGVTTASTTPISFRSSVDVQNGYAGREDFCAQAPLTGQVRYDGASGVARLTLDVTGLPANAGVFVAWTNSPAGTHAGYVVAYFRTDATGQAVRTSLRFYRPGEARALRIDLNKEEDPPTSRPLHLGTLYPC